MSSVSWKAWHLDVFTWGWIGWLIFFFVWETLALMDTPFDTLTFHLRPIFQFQPLAWFIGVGVWVWLGYHFFLEAGHPLKLG